MLRWGRLVRGGVTAAAIAVAFVSCRLDQLLLSSAPPGLAADPPALADSATRGSTAMLTRSVLLTGEAIPGAPWTATLAGTSAWLKLRSTHDTIPADLAVSLNPVGLPTGDYSDTIVVTSPFYGEAVKVPVRFTVLPAPAPVATKLAFTAQPPAAAVGTSLSPAVSVAAEDASGNTVTAWSGDITMTIGTNAGGGTLGGTRTVTAVHGIATFSNLSIDRIGNGYTLVATAPDLADVESSRFNITAGGVSASRSTLSVSSSTITASNGSSKTTITVSVMDADGNVIAGAPVSLSVGGSGNALSPESGSTNASGVFTATLSATEAGSHAVSATAAGVRLSQTATVTVNAATAAKLVFTQQPSDVDELDAISPPVEVTAQDAFGNVATGFRSAISVSLAGGKKDAILFGTLAVVANAGVATFSNLHIYRDGNGFSLTASAPGLAGATSAKFKVNH